MCAAGTKGFGNYLMDMAYKLAYKLGCSTVALAALPDAAGFYYGKHGFRFANRDGDLVNIEDTPWHKETEEGVRLVPYYNYTNASRKKRSHEALEGPDTRQDLEPGEEPRPGENGPPNKRPALLRYLASLFLGQWD